MLNIDEVTTTTTKAATAIATPPPEVVVTSTWAATAVTKENSTHINFMCITREHVNIMAEYTYYAQFDGINSQNIKLYTKSSINIMLVYSKGVRQQKSGK